MDSLIMFRLATQEAGILKNMLTVVASGSETPVTEFRSALSIALRESEIPDELILIVEAQQVPHVLSQFAGDEVLVGYIEHLSERTTVILIGRDEEGNEIERHFIVQATFKPAKPSLH